MTTFAQSTYDEYSQPYPAAARPQLLQPRIETGGRVGTERSIGAMEGWAPLIQDEASVLYTDIRWMADDESNQEGNLGVGYRQVVGDQIIGTHGWIDRRRTDRGSTFYQITGGVEYLKEDWDVKANAYVPLNKEKEYTTANSGNSNPYLAGTGLFVDTNGEIIEEAQPGGDIEIGYRIPAFEQNIDAIRVYGGAYGFIGDRTENVVGGRVRASIDINPMLNVGTRFQHDAPRGSQGFLEATLRFPFTAKKRFQVNRLKARLDESPERDIDIVTGAAVDNGLRKPVINTESQQVQRVLHVDNSVSAGGDGSAENPFNTLAAAQAALRDYDTVYIHAGNGTTSGQNQGFTINQNNVQVIGSGSNFVYDRDRFTVRKPNQNPTDGTLIAAATVAPVITNTENFVDDLTGNGIFIRGRDAMVSGVTVQNATGRGIYAFADSANLGDVTINNVMASGTNGNIRILTQNGGTINNVAVDHAIGSIVTRTTTNGTINKITLEDNNAPMQLQVRDNSSVGELIVRRQTVANASAHGMTINADGANAVIGNVVVEDSNVTNSGNEGIWIYGTNGGHVSDITVRNNTVTGSLNGTTGNGIRIQSWVNATIGNVTLENNTTTGNHSAGIYILAGNQGVIDQLTITGATTTGNTLHGLYIHAAAVNGRINHADVTNVIANGNTQNGIFLSTTSSGAMFRDMSFAYNDTLNNGTHGIWIQKTGAAHILEADFGGGALNSFGQNRSFGNTLRDIRLSYTGGGNIVAQHNWWDNTNGLQPSRMMIGATTPVTTLDTSNYLVADPRP